MNISTIDASLNGQTPATPRTILLLRPDAMGDLVLFSASLLSFRSLWPDSKISVLIREAHAGLARLLVPGVEWLTTSIDPFTHGPSDRADDLASVLESARRLAPDWVIAACSRRTWLDFAIADACPSARCVALASGAADRFFNGASNTPEKQKSAACFKEVVSIESDTPEWMRGQLLAEHLFGGKTDLRRPSINFTPNLIAEADEILAREGLARGGFLACAAAGFSNVRIKTWPAERFARIAAWLDQEKGMPVLLVGHESERDYLEAIKKAAGPADVRLWLGRADELPLLAALLGASRLYLGNDTGAMHLAAAAGVPVAGIFGGGTWPRFRSAAKRSLDLVCPMPCFGCEWDCAFGDAPCVGSIPETAVRDALQSLLQDGATELNELRRIEFPQSRLTALIEGASKLSRQKSELLQQRQQAFERTVALADMKDAEITSLTQSAAKRLEEADRKDIEIGQLKQATNEKDLEIGKLKQAANEKDLEINNLKTAASSKDGEIETKDAEIHIKEAEIHTKEAEINSQSAEMATLRAACQERLELIEHLDKTVKILLADKTGLSAEASVLRQDVAAARKAASDTEEFYKRLSPDAAQWAQQLSTAEANIAALRRQLTETQEELHFTKATLRERDQSLNNFAAGMGPLELHKYYHRLLREKEDVLQTLNRACQEREQLIRKLAMEATTPTARLHKFFVGFKGYWDARVSLPLRHGLEKRLLKGYWMQLGQLQQYAPKPVTWDRKLASHRRTSANAPRIGIVTPSFNQAAFLDKTMGSILGQEYPGLKYVVQDGGSKDGSVEVIKRHSPRLHAWESKKDAGQVDAIRRGFAKLTESLAPDDVMAWVNSDDLLAPGCLNFVGNFFARHPDVDAIYGHRIVIDALDREIGRWVLPRHSRETLRWIDYIPQETLFWRKRVWDRIGGLDPSFQFALDWDFLLRIQDSGTRLLRVPYFLGAFRVHGESKTSALIHTHGTQEMERVRHRVHGAGFDDSRLDAEVKKAQFDGAVSARLMALGIRR